MINDFKISKTVIGVNSNPWPKIRQIQKYQLSKYLKMNGYKIRIFWYTELNFKKPYQSKWMTVNNLISVVRYKKCRSRAERAEIFENDMQKRLYNNFLATSEQLLYFAAERTRNTRLSSYHRILNGALGSWYYLYDSYFSNLTRIFLLYPY